MLQATPYFQKFEEELRKKPSSPGVLRFRKSSPTFSDEEIVTDLASFLQVLGEPISSHFVHRDLEPLSHSISLLRFSNGSMGHFEFTRGVPHRIELEWSSQNTILEWDSARNHSWMDLGKTRSYREPNVQFHPIDLKWKELAEKWFIKEVTS